MVPTTMLAFVAFRGWIPHDEGTLGQNAVRILSGEWPHSDFLDVYPGLLGVLHAFFFAVGTPSIWTLRVSWLIVVGLTSAMLYLLLRRTVSGLWAAIGAIGATVGGFIFYPASMPNWWNVLFGAASLVLVLEGTERNRRSLVAAGGVVAGLGILIKTVGVYVAIPTFLWLIARQVSKGSERQLAVSCFASVGVLGVLLSKAASPGRAILLWLPAVLAVLWIWRSRPQGRNTEIAPSRFEGWIYLASVIAPASIVVFIYALTGRLSGLIDGWIVSPAVRFTSASNDVPILIFFPLLLSAVLVAYLLAVRKELESWYVVGKVSTCVLMAPARDRTPRRDHVKIDASSRRPGPHRCGCRHLRIDTNTAVERLLYGVYRPALAGGAHCHGKASAKISDCGGLNLGLGSLCSGRAR
jgi:hypothetical protein